MFEHYEAPQQRKFDLDQSEVGELVEIFQSLVEVDLSGEEESVTVQPGTLIGLGLMSFRAGRSYQDSSTDDQVVTVRIPVEKAGKFIEALIADAD